MSEEMKACGRLSQDWVIERLRAAGIPESNCKTLYAGHRLSIDLENLTEFANTVAASVQPAPATGERILITDFDLMLANCISAATHEKRQEFRAALLKAIHAEIEQAKGAAPATGGDLDVEAERRDFEKSGITGMLDRCTEPGYSDEYADPFTRFAWRAWELRAARSAAQGNAGAAPGDAEKKLAHGHRDDYYLMANARQLAMRPIYAIQHMQNWVLAKGLFATGSTSARQICTDAGIDPDGTKVDRAPSPNNSPVGGKE